MQITQQALMEFIDTEGVTFAKEQNKSLSICLNGNIVVCQGHKIIYRGTDLDKATNTYNEILS